MTAAPSAPHRTALVISGLVPDARRPGTVRIEVAGARFGTVPAELVVTERLAVGATLSDELATRLGAAADLEAVYRTVLESLRRRSHARADLGRRLVRRGHPRAAVEMALDRAQAAGLLDDENYVVHYVQTRSARGQGPARIKRDLAARGVDREVIARVLAAEWPADTDITAIALALAVKRAATLGNLPRPVKRRRLVAYLARRGFTGRDALEVVAKAVP